MASFLPLCRVAGAAVSMGMEVEGKLGGRQVAACGISLYNNVEEGISQGKMIFLRKNREKKVAISLVL